MSDELILRMYFRKNLIDEPSYLSVNNLEEAVESVEIFGNRWHFYDLEMDTENGWVAYRNWKGEGLKELLKK